MLFNKFLKDLTTHEQRVAYGVGDDVSPEDSRFTKPNLAGMRLLEEDGEEHRQEQD